MAQDLSNLQTRSDPTIRCDQQISRRVMSMDKTYRPHTNVDEVYTNSILVLFVGYLAAELFVLSAKIELKGCVQI